MDAIMDECMVALEHRHLVIETVHKMKKENKFIQEIII